MALAPTTVQRMPARLNGAPICLQPASTTPEEMHRPVKVVVMRGADRKGA